MSVGASVGKDGVTAARTEVITSTERNRWLVLAFIGIGSFMGALDTFVVNVAIPSLRNDLGATTGEAEFVVTAYALTFAVLLITGGRLGDLFGRVRVYLTGMGVFTVASALCAMAPSPTFLIGARVVQAAGAAVMVPQAYAVVQRIFNPTERVRAIAYLTVSGSVAVIFAQVVGGLLIQANVAGLQWRAVFAINVPIGLVGLIGGLIVLPRVRPERTAGLDMPGVGLATVALLLLIVPLVEGRDLGWPAWIIGLLVLAPLAFVAFAKHQMHRAAQRRFPLIEPGLFRQRSFSAGLPIVLITQISNAGLFFVFTLYLQLGRGLSPGMAGLAFASIGAGYMSTALLSPRLAVRFGRGVIVVGYATVGVAALAAIVILHVAGPTGSPFSLMPATAMVGAGQGLVNSPLFGIVLSRVERGHEGSASGTLSTVQQTGSAVGVALEGLVFFSVLGSAAVVGHGSAVAYTHAFETALILNVVIDLVAAALVPRLPRRVPSGDTGWVGEATVSIPAVAGEA